MIPIKIWPTPSLRSGGGLADGVIALAATGTRLYIGLGFQDGYSAGNGTAEVWSWDGQSAFERICAPDYFGGGVQTMLGFGQLSVTTGAP